MSLPRAASAVGGPGGAIFCLTAAACVYIDYAGDIFSSTDPTGGAAAWQQAAAPTASGAGMNPWAGNGDPVLSCSSSTFCMAIDGQGDVVSSDDAFGPDPVWNEAGVIPGVNTREADELAISAVSSLTCIPTGSCAVAPGLGAGDPTGAILTTSDPASAVPSWQAQSINSADIDALSCTPVGLCLATAQNGTVIQTADPAVGASAWTTSGPVARTGPEPLSLSAISCPTSSSCFASDELYGDVASVIHPGSSAATWQVISADPGAGLKGISCPSMHFCVAAGPGDALTTATDPTGPASAWSPVTLPFSYEASSIQGRDDFSSIACASAQLCIAPDDDYSDIAVSHDPGGGPGKWRVAFGEEDYDQFAGTSCPSVRVCVAVGVEGDVYTTAGKGRIFRATPSTADSSGGARLDQVSCPAVGLCVATGDIGFYSAAPEAVYIGSPSHGHWRQTRLERTSKSSLEDINCATAHFCVADDSAGRVFVSTDPTGGAKAWKLTTLAKGERLGGISCPSASECLVLGTRGRVYVGTR